MTISTAYQLADFSIVEDNGVDKEGNAKVRLHRTTACLTYDLSGEDLISCEVKVTDIKGNYQPGFSLTISKDLDVITTESQDPIFAGKEITCLNEGSEIKGNGQVAIAAIQHLARDYRANPHGSIVEPIAILLKLIYDRVNESQTRDGLKAKTMRSIAPSDLIECFADVLKDPRVEGLDTPLTAYCLQAQSYLQSQAKSA